MKIYSTQQDIRDSIIGIIDLFPDNTIRIINHPSLKSEVDNLIYTYVFSDNLNTKKKVSWLIRESARELGIVPDSTQKVYESFAKGLEHNKTVPAMNIRGITYEAARAIFRSAIKNNVGLFIFEIARSEMRYTQQTPEEYVTAILAAAIKEGFKGNVFIQGDHFQVSSKKYRAAPETELQELKDLIKKAIEAGFYNIDIDASTLVDLTKPTVEEQQMLNARITAEMTVWIRSLQPAGITISVGGEIGEVGKQNSTPEELRAFMKQYHSFLPSGTFGLSKISVQTGTKHGGVVLPDGSIAHVSLDFETLRNLSEIARQEFGMAGAVQHGASTLPDDAFDKFPLHGTAEVHLATGFQNIIYEHPSFPADLLKQIDDHLLKNHSDERKAQDTEEQFLYKTRKKAFGPFKKQMWNMPTDKLAPITQALEDKVSFLFNKLNVVNTKNLVSQV
ncbi:MAG: class II fructose-bisphosphate aldolase [Planctomycetota bacterium]|nr:class II fructose-bisphosphate aldolase [Planctomycetota bacterium]MDI6787612.1 class II fructose-bisphosphate aldolase [Planctomycetota bacterium]